MFLKNKPIGVALLLGLTVLVSCNNDHVLKSHGAIIRTDTTEKAINLIFSAHEFADGFNTINHVLDKHHIKASFFFTGDFYRNPEFDSIIKTLQDEGHYLGGHSDKHLLYCDWTKRDSLLVNYQTFSKDIDHLYAAMQRFGISKTDAPYFLPPYEWYNDTISRWCQRKGLILINFSPGTSSNADYTYPELGKQYKDSETVYNRILDYESKKGLNGFILLTHFGTDPRRTDKFYDKLDALLTELEKRGYHFTTLRESLK